MKSTSILKNSSILKEASVLKNSSLLKPNKIVFSHQINNEGKCKNSNRGGNAPHARSSMSDITLVPSTSRRSITNNQSISNKQNQQSCRIKQTVRDHEKIGRKHGQKQNNQDQNKFSVKQKYQNKLKYQSRQKPQTRQCVKSKKMPNFQPDQKLKRDEQIHTLNRIYRNQSMQLCRGQISKAQISRGQMSRAQISRAQILQEKCQNSQLDQEHISHRQNSGRKGKPLRILNSVQPSHRKLKAHQKSQNQQKLSRSCLSDKSMLLKDQYSLPNQQNTIAHKKGQSKNHQKRNPIQNIKKLAQNNISDKKFLLANKPMISLIRKSQPLHSHQHNHLKDQDFKQNLAEHRRVGSSTQFVKESISECTNQEEIQKIKRLALVQRFPSINQTRQHSRLQWLIVINQFYSDFKGDNSKDQSKDIHPYLSQIFCFLEAYSNDENSHTLINLPKKGNYQCDQKLSLTQLITYLVKSIEKNKGQRQQFTQNNHPQQFNVLQLKISFCDIGKLLFFHQSIIKSLSKFQKQLTTLKKQKISSQILSDRKQSEALKNPHSISTKEDEEIVQTARFQNNESNGIFQSIRNQGDSLQSKLKKKKLSMLKSQNALIYQESFDAIINSKLKKSIQFQPNKSEITTINKKDKNFCKKSKDKRQISAQQQSSQTDLNDKQPISKVFSGKYVNRSDIQDISQILHLNQNQKPLVASFNKKYNSFKQSSFCDPFQDNSLLQPYERSQNTEQGIKSIYCSKTNEDRIIMGEECKLQSLHMNSSKLFLESVILSNLYHTNFNISFSEQPLQSDSFLLNSQCIDGLERQEYCKFQDVLQEMQSIVKTMKNYFTINCESMIQNTNSYKNISNQSIKIQDLTQMEQFLGQFTQYTLFRKEKKNNCPNDYFYAVKITEANLTSFGTKKAAQNVIKTDLIVKYFSYIEGIRINQSPLMTKNIQSLLSLNCNIKILNLCGNQISNLVSVGKIISQNLPTIQFINLSNNRISSLASLFKIIKSSCDKQERKTFGELRQLHMKNNRIKQLNYEVFRGNKSSDVDFPNLQMVDFRSNCIDRHQLQSVMNLIEQSPQLNIMALKFNPLVTEKSSQNSQIMTKLNERSIYEYDSLQMMSGYIKYKEITFSDSTQFCCSIVEDENNMQSPELGYPQADNLKKDKLQIPSIKQKSSQFQQQKKNKDRFKVTKNSSELQVGTQQKKVSIKRRIKSIKNLQISQDFY